jgi:hypothetical protein
MSPVRTNELSGRIRSDTIAAIASAERQRIHGYPSSVV